MTTSLLVLVIRPHICVYAQHSLASSCRLGLMWEGMTCIPYDTVRISKSHNGSERKKDLHLGKLPYNSIVNLMNTRGKFSTSKGRVTF